MKGLGIKLACLVVAVVIWIQVAASHHIEETLYLPLKLVNLREEYTLAGNEVPTEVRVRLQGSKLRFLAHRYLGRRAGVVEVDLSGEEPGPPISREITINDVRSDLEVNEITPAVRLRLRIGREVSRKAPVEIRTEGKLPSQRLLLVPPVADPDSVTLTGPERFFTGEEKVPTEPVDLGKIKGETTVSVALNSPHRYLILDLQEVKVTLLVAPVETRRLANVPIVPLVDADQPTVTVYPTVADLVVSGPADSVRALEPSRVTVTISLTGLPEGLHHLHGQVVLPDCLSLVSVEPKEYMAIIGDEDEDGGEP